MPVSWHKYAECLSLPLQLVKTLNGNASINVGTSNPNTRPATPTRTREGGLRGLANGTGDALQRSGD